MTPEESGTPPRILNPGEREMTFEEVKAAPIGSRVNIRGTDEDGIPRRIECTVAGHYEGTTLKTKFLTYRDHGKIKKCAIKEYENKFYTKEYGLPEERPEGRTGRKTSGRQENAEESSNNPLQRGQQRIL